MIGRWGISVLLCAWLVLTPRARADDVPRVANDTDPASRDWFEKQVRPLLANHCYACHGPKTDEGEAKLRLDSRGRMLRGGANGPALVPGEPDRSLIILAVRHDPSLTPMPPKKKLALAEIEILETWVRQGANWPGDDQAEETATSMPTVQAAPMDQSGWAFQPPQRRAVPDDPSAAWEPGVDGSSNPVDAWLASRHASLHLRHAGPADKFALLRRACLDLTGLPPTPAEMEQFVADDSPQAFAKVVDRLLASPRYGERWGRHWLDVVRYADSNGMDDNLAYGDAWRYRDYVVDAFHNDLPYDQFAREQIAGDLYTDWSDPRHAEGLVATGLLALGPKMLAEDDPVKQQLDIVDEQLDTVFRAFLGLTIGCARCHDHKFDPLSISDYYALAGIFASTRTMLGFRVDSKWNATALESQVQEARLSELEQILDEHDNALVNGRADMSTEERTHHEQAKASALEEYARIPKAMAVEEGTVADWPVLHRGNHLTPGSIVPRGFPMVFGGGRTPTIGVTTSGRRELADWMTCADHPLTARVICNRVWQHHFGQGLVRSVDNFGRLGETPDHPELLDWLACHFVDLGWSIKSLQRTIMLSQAYQMSTSFLPDSAAMDPENRQLWRMNRRRLDAETLRDSLLFLGGGLETSMGGPASTLASFVNVTVDAAGKEAREGKLHASPRRGVYLPVFRSAVYDLFQAFDFPDPAVPSGMRQPTSVPVQALFMMNGDLVTRAANELTDRLLSVEGESDADRLDAAYRIVLGHPPTPSALDAWRAYWDQAGISHDLSAEARRTVWVSACRVLLSSNEFLFIE